MIMPPREHDEDAVSIKPDAPERVPTTRAEVAKYCRAVIEDCSVEQECGMSCLTGVSSKSM